MYLTNLTKFMQASREKYSNVAIMFILTSFIYIGIDICGIYFLNKLTNNVFYNNGFDMFALISSNQEHRDDGLKDIAPHFAHVNICLQAIDEYVLNTFSMKWPLLWEFCLLIIDILPN